MKKLSLEELGRLSVAEAQTVSRRPLVLVLDDIRSLYNVGSVFRSADAFLVQQICLCGITPQPPHREIHKTALGAEDTVPWTYYPDVLTCAQVLQEQGYRVVPVEQADQSQPLHQFSWDGQQPLALVLGNEVEGVSAQLVAASEVCLEIPQFGAKHSLNVSVSAGIVLWHLVQQTL